MSQEENSEFERFAEQLNAEAATKMAAIRTLNDQLRCHRSGGQVLITDGIAALGQPTVNTIMSAVAAFDAFTPGNDPWSEHDCAVLTVSGLRIIWKIDYYDPTGTNGSDDAADASVTLRVMTVMLAEEY